MRILGLFFLFSFVPFLYGLFKLEKKLPRKTYCLRLLLIIFISLGFSLISYIFLRKYHWYEYLLLDSIVANFLSSIVIPIFFDKRKNIYKNILSFFSLFALSVALYSTLTYGQIAIDSDTAIATILADKQLRHRSLFPRTWNYANGDVLVLFINLVILPFIRIIHNQSFLRAFASALWILLSCVGVFVLSEKTFKDSSWKLVVPFVLLFITQSNIAAMILYQAAYIGQLTIVCFSVVLALGFFRVDQNSNFPLLICHKKNICKIILFFIFMFLLVLGGSRQIGEIILPLMLSFVAFSIIETTSENTDNKKNFKQSLFMVLIVATPAVLGFLCYKRVSATHNVNNSVNNAMLFTGNIQSWWSNLESLISNHFFIYGITSGVFVGSLEGLKNLVSIFSAIFISFIIPVLQLSKIKTEDKNVVFFCLFAFIHNIIIFLLIIFMQKTTVRYTLSSVFLEIIVSSHYIYKYWFKENKFVFVRSVLVFIVVLGIVINATYCLSQSKGWHEKLVQKRQFVSWLKSFNCKKGYATYWNAYTNEVYSNLDIRFGAVNFEGNELTPFYWLVDSDVYDYTENKPSFLLLDEKETGYAASESFQRIFGKPGKILTYENYTAFLFDYDIAQVFKGNESWSKVLSGKMLDEFAEITTRDINFIDEISFIDEKGFLVSKSSGVLAYGPYSQITKGRYCVKVLYDLPEPVVDSLGTISITTESGKNNLYSGNLPNANEFSFVFEVQKDSNAFEIVTTANCPNLILRGYEIKKLGDN